MAIKKDRIRVYVGNTYIEYIAIADTLYIRNESVSFTDENGEHHRIIGAAVIIDFDYEPSKE